MRWCWSRSKSLIFEGANGRLTGAASASMFRASSGERGFGPLGPHPAPAHCWIKAYPDTIEGESREQAREFEVQDRPPPQGQPVGPSQEPDQQARIRSRPARPGPPEADRLPPPVDGEAAPQGLLRLGFGAPAPPLLSRGGAPPRRYRREPGRDPRASSRTP